MKQPPPQIKRLDVLFMLSCWDSLPVSQFSFYRSSFFFILARVSFSGVVQLFLVVGVVVVLSTTPTVGKYNMRTYGNSVCECVSVCPARSSFVLLASSVAINAKRARSGCSYVAAASSGSSSGLASASSGAIIRGCGKTPRRLRDKWGTCDST